MTRQFKAGDIVDGVATGNVRHDVSGKMITRINLKHGHYWAGGVPYEKGELTLIRAVDDKTYEGQFEVGNAPSFNKMLDNLPFQFSAIVLIALCRSKLK